MLGFFIRTKFTCTSRQQAQTQIESEARQTLALASSLESAMASRSVEVPKMIGVDEDMRKWSLFQTLEHNVIVNESITDLVLTLSSEQAVVTDFDPKSDVMPSPEPGAEQIERFQASVETHLQQVATLPQLRSQQRYPHPLFGNFNAHQWYCMFGFHLMLHRRQMEKAVQLLKE